MAENEKVPFIYANAVEAHLGPFDMTLDFGFKLPEQRQSTNYEKRATVVMSLSHAKTMIPILTSLIARYEQEFGQIPAPGYEDKAKE